MVKRTRGFWRSATESTRRSLLIKNGIVWLMIMPKLAHALKQINKIEKLGSRKKYVAAQGDNSYTEANSVLMFRRCLGLSSMVIPRKTVLRTEFSRHDGSYLAELVVEKGYEIHNITRRALLHNTRCNGQIYQAPSALHLSFQTPSRRFSGLQIDMANFRNIAR